MRSRAHEVKRKWAGYYNRVEVIAMIEAAFDAADLSRSGDISAAYRAGQIAQAQKDARIVNDIFAKSRPARGALIDGVQFVLADDLIKSLGEIQSEIDVTIRANAERLRTAPTTTTDQILNRMVEDNKAFQRDFEEDFKRRVEANAERLRAKNEGDEK